tara:strand:+ start:380 stop:805 length:426 start_codon:yes stop_codon:yes gene_type:complete
MKQLKRYIFTLGIILLAPNLFAVEKDKATTDLIGSVWQLVKNGSPSHSFGTGQVVYFLPSDAYHTLRSRKFQTWDAFSMVDGRNLVRLKKNDEIQIVNSKRNDSIYEVKLLNGFNKGRTYYLIAEELEKNFKQESKENENI